MTNRLAKVALSASLILALGYACSEARQHVGVSEAPWQSRLQNTSYDPSTRTLGVTVGSSQGNNWTGTAWRTIKTNVTGAVGPHYVQWWQSWCYNDGSDYCSDQQIV